MAKYLKNTTVADIFIGDTGINLTASSTYTVPARDYLLWANSSNISAYLVSGDVVVNDGIRDLSATVGAAFIKYPDKAENIYFASPPDAVNVLTARTVQAAIEQVNTQTLVSAADTTLGYLASKIVGTLGRLTATIINAGGNEQLKLDVDATEGVPIGTIIDFAGSSAPTKYLRCDGSAVSRTTYASLFTAIGTLWGVGDGSTTFNLPTGDGVALWGADGSHAVGSFTGTDSVNLAHTHGVGTLVNDTVAAHTHSDGTLATDSQGAHTHSADGTLATDTVAAHTHTIAHTHQIDPPSATTSGPSSTSATQLVLGAVASSTHTHTVDIPAFTSGAESTANSGSGGSHSHDVTGNTSSDGNHAHDVTGATGSNGSHSHTISGATDSQLTTVDKRPARIHTLKCIRATA
jgi:microcystin-dependent protein